MYSAIHRMIIVLKDRATHRVAKRIAPSLSLLKGPSLMGKISNFYNLSARLLIFNTHIAPIITTHTSKFRSCLSDTF